MSFRVQRVPGAARPQPVVVVGATVVRTVFVVVACVVLVVGAVVAEALEVLASGEPRLCTFGYSDEEAFSVGLTCGGTVRLFVEPLD